MVGPNAPIRFEGIKATCSKNAYDFYKPNMDSPFPTVDGKLSINCYFDALDYCFERYKTNFERITGEKFEIENSANFFLFHSPFVKLVRKSFARIYFNEWRRGNLDLCSDFAGVDPNLRNISNEASYTHNEMFKIFTEITNQR